MSKKEHWLWSDTAVFSDRYQKSAAALIAIKRTLEKNRPLNGQEQDFLDQLDYCIGADQELFTRVWTDPTAYFWVRMAYQLLAHCLSGSPPTALAERYRKALNFNSLTDALVYHLNDFNRFILALHYIAGTDCEFESPLRIQFPFAIPGTRLSIGMEGEAEIQGISDKTLRLVTGNKNYQLSLTPDKSGAVSVFECPLAKQGDYALPLNPHVFNNLPGLLLLDPALISNLEYQHTHVELVEKALSALHRYHPECFSQFREVMRYLALKPLKAGDYANVSHSELPGLFMVSVANNFYLMADAFIHEFHHFRLFALEEKGPFLEENGADPLRDEIYYSPWRNDLRPLHGILHAVYVTLPTTEYWINVATSNDVNGEMLNYVQGRIVRAVLQLDIGLYQLERFGKFTEYGNPVLQELIGSAEKIKSTAQQFFPASQLPAIQCMEDGQFKNEVSETSGQPFSVDKMVEEHVSLHAPEIQRREIFEHIQIN